MVGVISQVENGCQAVANSLLVLVPYKTLHGTISFLIQRTKLAANVGKTRAVKNKMPLIPQRPGLAQSAAAEMPGDGWSCKPTSFNWQSMRPHAELHQQLQSGNEHWNFKIWHSSGNEHWNFKIWHTSIDWGAETKQSMCRAWPSWRELFLGRQADHPKPFLADPPCSPETRGSSGMYCQKMKTVRPCQDGCTA